MPASPSPVRSAVWCPTEQSRVGARFGSDCVALCLIEQLTKRLHSHLRQFPKNGRFNRRDWLTSLTGNPGVPFFRFPLEICFSRSICFCPPFWLQPNFLFQVFWI